MLDSCQSFVWTASNINSRDHCKASIIANANNLVNLDHKRNHILYSVYGEGGSDAGWFFNVKLGFSLKLLMTWKVYNYFQIQLREDPVKFRKIILNQQSTDMVWHWHDDTSQELQIAKAAFQTRLPDTQDASLLLNDAFHNPDLYEVFLACDSSPCYRCFPAEFNNRLEACRMTGAVLVVAFVKDKENRDQYVLNLRNSRLFPRFEGTSLKDMYDILTYYYTFLIMPEITFPWIYQSCLLVGPVVARLENKVKQYLFGVPTYLTTLKIAGEDYNKEIKDDSFTLITLTFLFNSDSGGASRILLNQLVRMKIIPSS